MMKFIASLLALCSAGCPAAVGVSGSTYVPRDAAQICASHCGQIGMALNSVVIMASNVGCVCSGGPAAPGAAATSGGMAAVMMDEEQRRRSQQSQSHHTPPPSPPSLHH